MKYKVNEIFYSLQGEGMHTGTAAVFVRFSGCNLYCDFCDTQHFSFSEMTCDEIVAEIEKHPAHIVILTGGEPSLQVDKKLVDAIHSIGRRVHIETNGTNLLPLGIDWVTCSPKNGGKVVLMRIDELKVVYEGQDLQQYNCFICPNRFLQPRSNINVAETIKAVELNPDWRLSLQTHIIIGIK